MENQNIILGGTSKTILFIGGPLKGEVNYK